jgi:hypothetical protein
MLIDANSKQEAQEFAQKQHCDNDCPITATVCIDKVNRPAARSCTDADGPS